jgi:adenine/guanine phosphoribosyltransferase-like PRPP-binding protein
VSAAPDASGTSRDEVPEVTPGTTDWKGDWVAQRLGVALRTSDAPLGVDLNALVGLAVRRNPRRAHLLVSTVLGKHLPTDPYLVYGSGLLLGRLVAQTLRAPAGSAHPRDLAGGNLLQLALRGAKDAGRHLTNHVRHAADTVYEAGQAPVVLGYAETATGLGHAVADALDVSTLHSTRRSVPGVTPVGGFEEEHSHASTHLLLPEDPDLLAGTNPLVLVDDELSTGTTALNTIAALHALYPRSHYVIAALVDLRSDVDRTRMAEVAADLGVRIDMVALAAGRVELPDNILTAGLELVAETEASQVAIAVDMEEGAAHAPATTERVNIPSPSPRRMREGGRHGFSPGDRVVLSAYLDDVADAVLDLVTAARSRTVHVLGFEELMYAPLLLATKLAERTEGVTYSTTTRSPVLAVPHTGYAIRSRLMFASHDNPDDGPGERYTYNVAAPTAAETAFGTVVLVVDTAGDTLELAAPGGLVDQLARDAGHVVVVTIPDHRPSPTTTPDSNETTYGDTQ